MEGGRPAFGKVCDMCLGCLYGCPRNALSPGFLKGVLIKEGYDLERSAAKPMPEGGVDLDKLVPGKAWAGFRRYLAGGEDRT
jgi:ferredoxin